jgi:hypothetical protein
MNDVDRAAPGDAAQPRDLDYYTDYEGVRHSGDTSWADQYQPGTDAQSLAGTDLAV